MASSDLQVTITGIDNASPVFKNFGNFLKGSFKTALFGATAGLGALTTGLGLSIKEAIDAEEIQNKLGAVLESTGGIAGVTADEANSLASELSKLTKFSDDQIVSAETMLLTFTNIGEKVFPQATEAVLNMAEMFGSADEAAVQLGKVLQDPIGKIASLERMGITFTDTQKDMIKGFVESGQMAKAQGVILAELDKEFGGVARAAGKGLGGQLTILENQFLDIFESVGMRFLPALTSIVSFINTSALPVLTDFVDNAIGKITPFIESAAWSFERFADALGSGMSFTDALKNLFLDLNTTFEWFLVQLGVAPDFADKLTDAIRPLADSIKPFIETIKEFVTQHADAFKNALIAIGAVLGGAAIIGGILAIGAAIASLFNPFTLLIVAVGVLAAAWTEDWGGIRTYFMDNIWPSLKIALNQLAIWLQEYIPQAIDALKDYWNNVLLPTLFLLKLFWENTLKPALNQLWEWLKTYIPVAIDALKAYWETVLLPALDKLKQFWDNVLLPLFEDFDEWLTTNIPVAMQALSDAWTNILKPGLEGISNFWYGTLLPALLDIEDWLQTYLPNAVGIAKSVFDGFKNTLWDVWGGIQSLKGQIEGLAGKFGELANKMPGMFIPGSPTPFELGLRGIESGVRDLDAAMGRFGSSQGFNNLAGGQHGGDTTNNNFNLTVHTNGGNENVIGDFGMMRTWAGA